MKTSTSTISTSKYNDWFLDEIIEFVYGASSEEEAIYNIKKIMESYDRKISFSKLIILLTKK